MTGALQLGPFSLAWPLLITLAAIALASFTGRRVARRSGLDLEPVVFRSLLLGFGVARLAFVLPFATLYAAQPLAILDIRDGGWRPLAGWAAVWLYVLWVAWRRPAFRRAALAGAATGTLVWGLATAVLALVAPVQSSLPSLALTRLSGEAVTLQAYKGKPLVLNIWATWCPPCQREMPVLARAQQKWPGVEVVFVNQKESALTVQRFLAGKNLQLQHVLLDAQGGVAGYFGQRALPTTLFFNAEGELLDTRIGELSDASLADRIEALGMATAP